MNGMLTKSNSMPIVQNSYLTVERVRFPVSKHRSRRLKKKLEKRLGGNQFYRVPDPSFYIIDGKIVGHPQIVSAFIESQKVKSIDLSAVTI